MLSAQLGCSPRASCLGLVTPRAVERADLVPTCSAGEEGPRGSLHLSCCQLGEFQLFASGTKQLTSELLLLRVRWGNGEKWVASSLSDAGRKYGCVKVPISCQAVVETGRTTSTPGSDSYQIPSQGDVLRHEDVAQCMGQGGQ